MHGQKQKTGKILLRLRLPELRDEGFLPQREVRKMHMYELAGESFLYGVSAIVFCVVVVGILSFIKNKCKKLCQEKSLEEKN